MINDAQGFLWIGSDHGAHKYDGYYFTIYKYIQNDSTSLLNESIMDLFKDSKGNLWLATKIGFNKWILETESFERYYLDSNNTGKTDINFVNDINEDNKSKLWICSQGSGLTVFNLQSKEMMHYKFDAFDSNSISNDTTLFTYMADDNQLFKGSR
jgi:ligand-binding sensor domain-containing protein